jgi:hypothetical protein
VVAWTPVTGKFHEARSFCRCGRNEARVKWRDFSLALNARRSDARRASRERTAHDMLTMNSPDPEPLHADLQPFVDQAIHALPELDQRVLVMRYFDHCQQQEIAQRLGVNAGAVQKRLARALERVRQHLARRGVAVPAVALAAWFSGSSVEAAPPALGAAIAASALPHGAAGTGFLSKLITIMTQIKALAAAPVARFIAGALAEQETAPPYPRHPAARPATTTLLATDAKALGNMPLLAMPQRGTLDNLTPADAYRFSQQLASLGANDPTLRSRLLTEAKLREEPERQTLLFQLLTGWASTDPKAAADWALAELGELGNGPRRMCLLQIARTWAVSDGMGLAHWADQAKLSEKDDLRFIESEIGLALVSCDSLAWARFQEMPCNANSVLGGDSDAVPARLFDSPDFVRKMAAAVQEQVSYAPDNLPWNLKHGSSSRHTKQKDAWNILFEQTANACHQLAPASCDTWLQTFPSEARQAAQFFIAKGGTPPPAAFSEEPTLLPPAQRLTSAPPVPGLAEDTSRKDWSEWWRTDPTAAEAFLDTAAWSDNQKFRARAKAYSSAP